MNRKPISEIKNTLKTMYPGYNFDMKCSPLKNTYIISVFKNGNTLSTINMAPDVPMDLFWEKIKGWMKPLLSYYHRK
jgi:hypothetical protein